MTTTDAIAAIRKARGSLKRKPGDKPFAEEWAAYKREERKLEDAKSARSITPGEKNVAGAETRA